MNYPDGAPIQVGDLVWWNEGVCVGFIQWIWDERRDGDYSWAKTDGPPLFISNRHPYAPSSEAFGSGVIHDESCLEDEGIGLLDAAEMKELGLAMSLAKARSRSGLSGSFHAVQTRAENCQLMEWVFLVYEDDTCVEEIVIRRSELDGALVPESPTDGSSRG